MIFGNSITLALGFLSATAISAPTGLALTAERCLAIKNQAGFLRCVNDFSSGELAHAVQKGRGGPCYAANTGTGLTCLDDLNKVTNTEADEEEDTEDAEKCLAVEDTDGETKCLEDVTGNTEQDAQDKFHIQSLKRSENTCIAVVDAAGAIKCSTSKRELAERANSACMATIDSATGIIKCMSDLSKRATNSCIAIATDSGEIKCAESKRELAERANSACLASTDSATGMIKCTSDLSKRSSSTCLAATDAATGTVKCIEGLTRRSKRSATPNAEPTASDCLVSSKTTEGLMSCLEAVDKREEGLGLAKRSSSSCTTVANAAGVISCLEDLNTASLSKRTMCLATTDSTGSIRCLEQDAAKDAEKRSSTRQPCLAIIRSSGVMKCIEA